VKNLSPIFFVVAYSLFLVTYGCGGSEGGGQTPPPAISVTVSPTVTAIGIGQSQQFTATVTGDTGGVTWTASAGTIDAMGNFTAPAGPASSVATVTATSKTDTTKVASASINVVAPGNSVLTTTNVQVAQYTITPAAAADVSVEFGPDTNYGLNTWTQPTPTGGGAVSLFVAGMRANTLYHMRGIVKFKDGSQYTDIDQTVTTGGLQVAQRPNIVVTTAPGTTPQSGVEVLNLITPSPATVVNMVVTDVAGNVIWTYNPAMNGRSPGPGKLLPNGHFLINYNFGIGVDGLNSIMQEVDLSGTVVWQMTADDLNNALAAATCAGCNITVAGTHHDFAILPNGHLVVIAGRQQMISGVNVTGDVLIDLDENRKPVWLWNEFDHLDTNRRPYLFPDWTHTNAVIYSPDDGNLTISIRHQNWLVKINYADGTGNGDVLWRMGYQGDFTLVGGTDPQDWFYAQHGPSFVGSKTAGNFSLVLFDNGDDRGVAAGPLCGTSGEPACYSTVPLLQIDETAKTVTLVANPTAPVYSFFGGNAEVLANGNVEFAESATLSTPTTNSTIYEMTQTSPPQPVWQMQITGQYAYRGMRIPSLYPGVQW